MSRFCAPETLNQDGTTYKLFALTEHIGSLDEGHYIAYTKRHDGRWFEFNDERIKEVSEDDALNQKAYLLFYQRVDTNWLKLHFNSL